MGFTSQEASAFSQSTLPNRSRGSLLANASNSLSSRSGSVRAWQRRQVADCSTFSEAEQEAKTVLPKRVVLPLWHAPQWNPPWFVEAETFVSPADMANPMSTWQTRHVNLARCCQWSKPTGGIRARREKLSRTTRP